MQLAGIEEFPFVSKVLRINFIDIATKLIMNVQLPPFKSSAFDLDYVGVKAPMFSFTRLKGSDPVLGVEMASTGEVACLGDDFDEAFLKSLISTGINIKPKSILLSTGSIKNKTEFLLEARLLSELGIKLYATEGTAKFLQENKIKVETLRWSSPGENSEVLSIIKDRKVDLVINIPRDNEVQSLENDYIIRRKAVDLNISLITNIEFARRYVKAIHKYFNGNLSVKSWDEYF